ncbi:Striatin family protein [Dictyocaulus viviparus]|uniref:Striatin family protein n=1 Tax=Dictyocaulus viviparus TaxID=29172 RepID=A0A0D8XTA3_DICVI|nr:Striatin family protein [Dictyocaulus viviparus]
MVVGMAGEGQLNNSLAQQQQNEQKDEQNRRPPYTMHGVLHFLQHEWSKYEMEKAKWEMERAEMQARISFLQGERKGQENLKADLVRRIKMLEYCLKQERAKNYRLTHNGQDPPEYEETENENTNEVVVPTEVDAYATEGGGALGWKHGRQLLKQYLQEIGYSEQILDVRSFRVKNLLGLIPKGDWPSNERVSVKGQKKDIDSDSEPDERDGPRGGLDSEAAEALEKFDFLHEQSSGSGTGCDDWAAVDQNMFDRLKEKYKSTKRSKRSSGNMDDLEEKRHSLNDTTVSSGTGAGGNPITGIRGKRDFMDINDALGLAPDDNIDIKDDFIIDDDEESLRSAKWSVKMTLRSHLDSIRAMQFHPVQPVLITAGEDGTAKLWNLDIAKEKSGSGSDIEPVYTFRGHLGPVLCMDLSPTGDYLFTGGRDGVICCWNVPSATSDPYEAYDPKVLTERLRGHKDAIWSVAYHSSDNRLVSASSDGTVMLWEPDAPSPGLIPTSVDFVSTEPSQLLIAYTSSAANIVDIETGCTILSFDFGEDITHGSSITRILSHPTMPLTITAGDDRKIRYFDNNTGKLTHSAVAHVEGISSLAIDPNGLYLLSGSHDGSLRMWNMEKRVCLQEISAHRKKYDASVTCVAFHPSRPLIGSAGADALAKVYCPASA